MKRYTAVCPNCHRVVTGHNRYGMQCQFCGGIFGRSDDRGAECSVAPPPAPPPPPAVLDAEDDEPKAVPLNEDELPPPVVEDARFPPEPPDGRGELPRFADHSDADDIDRQAIAFTDQPYRSYRPRSRSMASRRRRSSHQTTGQQCVAAAMVGGLVGGIAGVAFGAVSSQFFPIFGGFLTQIAQPMSPGRLQALPGHCLFCGIGGAMLAGLLAAGISFLSNDASRR